MIDQEALAWVIRTRDPAFADWDGFTVWLEASPAHASAYDALALADADLPAIVPPAPASAIPANDVGERRSRPLRWIGVGAIAAALVAAVSVGMLNRTDIYTIDTKPGEARSIALDDGTTIELNGGSSLRLDRKNARFAALDRGEASFSVTHDAADPFRVTVGEAVFEDAGTLFDIVAEGKDVRIGVAEGEVIYNPNAEAISLKAGRALRSDAGGVQLSAIAPDAVAAWRQGRLTYDNAPIADVTGDIARSLGVTIASVPRGMRFTGTILLDRDPQRFFAKAGPLLGVSASPSPQGWVLKVKDGPIS